ncbi:bifunctional oligoribonuclease/PAP phosphatase NrnA [Candidatus Berkelbacteria bacterium]|nr:bifunctional oligoribonuclease/PAP phosphatase NrnA [Candidatus Berkelbacteria bacterium]
MEQTPKQQIAELIKSSQRILLATHQGPDGDAIGSLLAMARVLKKLGKDVDAVTSDDVPGIFSFLPGFDELQTNFKVSRDFVIALNTTNAKVDKLGYKASEDGNTLDIVITPRSGSFEASDVQFKSGASRYDLIIVLDAPEIERLGPIFEENAPLFYETPLVNIDHHPANDHFGKINWVDITATSTAEILVALFESLSGSLGGTLIDEDISTCLLTGIITDTGSFQNQNTTPKSLTVAAQMVAAGARQQEIIVNIFKMKPLSTLRLWGRILERVRYVREGNFIYSVAYQKDLTETGASPHEISGVLDEVMKGTSQANFALLLTERGDTLHGSLRAIAKQADMGRIATSFGGGGHPPAAAFDVPATPAIEGALEQIITRITEVARELPVG